MDLSKEAYKARLKSLKDIERQDRKAKRIQHIKDKKIRDRVKLLDKISQTIPSPVYVDKKGTRSCPICGTIFKGTDIQWVKGVCFWDIGAFFYYKCHNPNCDYEYGVIHLEPTHW